MKHSQLRQIIKEEISKVLNKYNSSFNAEKKYMETHLNL
jgi:hypothetical protein